MGSFEALLLLVVTSESWHKRIPLFETSCWVFHISKFFTLPLRLFWQSSINGFSLHQLLFCNLFFVKFHSLNLVEQTIFQQLAFNVFYLDSLKLDRLIFLSFCSLSVLFFVLLESLKLLSLSLQIAWVSSSKSQLLDYFR